MANALAELGFERHDFDGPSGALSYSRAGEGLPLIMLHSLAMSSQMWAPLLAEFVVSHEVIVADARGHGHSSWPESSFSVVDMAADLLALLEDASMSQVDVLGLSMGGSTALTFAGLYPARVRKLVLCDTTSWYGPDAVEAWKGRSFTAESVGRSQQIPFQLDRWFTRGFRETHKEIIQLLTEIFENTDSNVHKEACLALGALDSRSLLPRITAPCLVMTGEDDKATPIEMGEYIANNVKNSVFEVVPGGHFAIFESSEGRASILDYLLQ